MTQTLRPFPAFATYPTQHCVTGSLKHIYDHHRLSDLRGDAARARPWARVSSTSTIKGTDPFYGGRANHASPEGEGLEKTAGRRTGVPRGVARHDERQQCPDQAA